MISLSAVAADPAAQAVLEEPPVDLADLAVQVDPAGLEVLLVDPAGPEVLLVDPAGLEVRLAALVDPAAQVVLARLAARVERSVIHGMTGGIRTAPTPARCIRPSTTRTELPYVYSTASCGLFPIRHWMMKTPMRLATMIPINR